MDGRRWGGCRLTAEEGLEAGVEGVPVGSRTSRRGI
jgi:hypothetical protein